MRWNSIAVFAALALMAAAASGARAEDSAQFDQYAKRIFAGKTAAKGKSYACFVRRYDAAHLAKHPEQKVAAMQLLVSAELLPEDKALNYSFSLGLKFRDRKEGFSSNGACGHPMASEESADKMQLGCGVDCDGGGLSVELIEADKAVLVRVDSIRLWPENQKDEDETSALDGPDDKLFKLERVNIGQCKPLMSEDDKPATM